MWRRRDHIQHDEQRQLSQLSWSVFWQFYATICMFSGHYIISYPHGMRPTRFLLYDNYDFEGDFCRYLFGKQCIALRCTIHMAASRDALNNWSGCLSHAPSDYQKRVLITPDTLGRMGVSQPTIYLSYLLLVVLHNHTMSHCAGRAPTAVTEETMRAAPSLHLMYNCSSTEY